MPISQTWEETAEALQVDEATLAAVAARFFHTEVASLEHAEPTAAKLLPESLVREFTVFPLRAEAHRLVVASADPTAVAAETAIGFASGRKPVVEIAPPRAILEAIEVAYAPDLAVESFLETFGEDLPEDLVEIVEAPEPHPVPVKDIATGPIVRLTNMILHTAVARGASGLHVKPAPGGGVVRYLVDGVLHTGLQLPFAVISGVIARLKVLGGLDIADRLRPQAGRARAMIMNRSYDLRIQTIPAGTAEKVVIRIVDPHQTTTLADAGLPEREVTRLRRLLRNREGILLITGPTGAGKTTTLYAVIRELSTEDVNIMTVEDPVEYELPGCTQVQVDRMRGVTFASGLRALLRQDPDVILVGEIRDEETAEMAVQASKTGRFVLTALHTNDALSAIRRLTDLGLDLNAVTDSLCGAVAQRLVRRMCDNCSVEVGDELTDEEIHLEALYGVRPTRRAVGCEVCGQLGYRGRVPLMESFLLSRELVDLLRADAPHHALLQQARDEGMSTLLDAALELVRAGETTLEEVERVVGDPGQFAAEALDGVPESGSAVERGEYVDPWSSPSPEPAESLPSTPAIDVTGLDSQVSDDPEIRVGPDSWTFGEAAGLLLPDAGASPRAIVVDDNPQDRHLAGALLELMGFLVTEAEDGIEAVKLLARENLYDLMILDLDMPRFGGLDVLRDVRGSQSTAGLPVIILTARTDRETEMRLLDLGADDYLSKPIDGPLFRSRVRATLRRAMG